MKAVLCAGGWGSRFLPVAKTMSKCMLPVLDKPVIHYIVEECARAGATDIAVVTPPGILGEQITRYFSRDPVTEAFFRDRGWGDRYEPAAHLHELADFTFIGQPMNGRYGTALPPLIARRFVGEGDFFLVNCDDLLQRFDGGSDLADLLAARDAAGTGAVIGAAMMDGERAANYGVLLTDPARPDRLSELRDKPRRLPPGRYAVAVGRALLPAEFMAHLENVEPAPGTGEFQVTDAYTSYAHYADILIHPLEGRYYDCGDVRGWLAANAAMADHRGIPIEGRPAIP
jgi:UTP--glucose-1-phosphate uridylyltransferase